MNPAVTLMLFTMVTNPMVQTKFQCNRVNDYVNVCPTNFDWCETCQEVISEVQEQLADPLVQKEIIALLELVCDSQPSPADAFCRGLVDEVVPLAIEEFLNVDPYAACHDLMVC